MQFVNLRLEDERGEMIEKSDANFAEVILELWEIENAKQKYPWTSSIDPYGYTIFNTHQAPIVKDELEKLKSNVHEEVKPVIENVINLLNKVDQHLYLRFIGD